jgi:uncharacterized protein YhfF
MRRLIYVITLAIVSIAMLFVVPVRFVVQMLMGEGDRAVDDFRQNRKDLTDFWRVAFTGEI